MKPEGLAISARLGKNRAKGVAAYMPEKMRKVPPHVAKQEESGQVYYTVFWSPLRKAEKFDIVRHVPAMAGIFELYYMDENERIRRMCISRAWYGGLRSKLRHDTDPELVMDKNWRKILDKYKCFYRYTLTNSMDDMLDVLHFFSKMYIPDQPVPQDSGRYQEIFLEEISPDKVVTI